MSRPADLLLRLGDTTPAWPTQGQISLYAKTDGTFYKLDSNGNESPLIGGASGGTGTVTSVAATGVGGVLVSGGPITNSGTFTIGLGDITPTSITSTGVIMGSNLIGVNTGDETITSIKEKLGITELSGVNTGDQTITLTGDVTGSGTGTFAATLTNVNPNVGTYGSTTHIPVFTVDAKGRITSVSSQEVGLTSANVTQALGYVPYDSSNPAGYTTNLGTVTYVDLIGHTGIEVIGSAITGSGEFNIRLGDITPASIMTPGTITGSNLTGTNTGDETKTSILTKLEVTALSGVNTGDQTITLTGDVVGTGTGTFNTSLAVVNTNIGTFGSSTQIPVVTVDDKGRITGISTVALSSSSVLAGVSSFNSRGGDVTLTHTDVVTALGYTPYDSANPGDYSSAQGTVKYIEIQGEDGIEVNGGIITETGTVSLHLTDIKPFTVAASGTITGSNLSGVNTGDQTITLVGDVTGSGTDLFETTLSDTGVVAGTYGTPTKVPHITVDSKGRVLRIAQIDIASSGIGSVTSVDVSGGTTGLTVDGGPVTNAGTLTLGGVLAIEHGGTGAVTAEDALNNLLPAQAGLAGQVLVTDGLNAQWQQVSGTGTVTDVSAVGENGVLASVTNSGTTPAITVGLGDITPDSVAATGTVTGSNLSGVNTGDQTITLVGDVSGSGTGEIVVELALSNSSPVTDGFVRITADGKGRVTDTSPVTGADITTVLGYVPYNSSNPLGYTSNLGTVTSVDVSGGATGLEFINGPVTSSGTISMTGVLSVEHGGTGATTLSEAINALLPAQGGNAGYVLTTDGSDILWSPAGTGTVTSVGLTGANGIVVTGGPVETAGQIGLSLGDITPNSVAAAGTVTGSNLSGVNTGDQTITLTGDLSGSGTGAIVAELSDTGVVPGTYTNSTITVDSKGRITDVESGAATSGTVTSVDLASPTGTVTVSGGPVTAAGTLQVDLPATGVAAGTYTNATVTVDEFGRVTNIVSGGATGRSFEKVVFKYTSGSGGTLNGPDCLVSTTDGVSVVITDGPNCIVNYTFSGHTTLPISVLMYGHVYAMNTFVMSDLTSMPMANRRIAGGGTAALPDIITGISSSNTVTLQHRMADSGAAASLGQRPYLIILFGF